MNKVKKNFIKSRIQEMLMHAYCTKHLPLESEDFAYFDMASFKKDLFGDGNWKYFKGLRADGTFLQYPVGIIFGNGRFAYMLSGNGDSEIIYLVKSNDFFNKSLSHVSDARLICNSDEFSDLRFAIMNCDKIENGTMSLWDFYERMGMHQE